MCTHVYLQSQHINIAMAYLSMQIMSVCSGDEADRRKQTHAALLYNTNSRILCINAVDCNA